MDNQESKQNENDEKGEDKDKQEKSTNEKFDDNPSDNINDGDDKGESFTAPPNPTSKYGSINSEDNKDNVVDNNVTLTSPTVKHDQSYDESANNPENSNIQSQGKVSKTSNEDSIVENNITLTSPTVKNNQSFDESANSPENSNIQSQEDVLEDNAVDNVEDAEPDTNEELRRIEEQREKEQKEKGEMERVASNNGDDTSPMTKNDKSYDESARSKKSNNKGKIKSAEEESMPFPTKDEFKDSKKENFMDKEQAKETSIGTATNQTQKMNQDEAHTGLTKSQKRRLKKERQAAEKAANNSSTGQHGSTSQIDVNYTSTSQNQQGGSLASTIYNTAKNFILPEEKPEEYPDRECVRITFHVHLPIDVSKQGDPVIMGSIKELGDWNEPKVKLHQFKRGYGGFRATSYWYSDPIVIPIEKFENTRVNYKYAVFTGKRRKNKNGPPFLYEGNDQSDDRVLELQCKNQFDIWMKNKNAPTERINDYMFLEVIYESINQNNFKDAILEYNYILKRNRELTISVTNFDFIGRRVSEKSIHKRLFLCFLLGHYRPNFISVPLELPPNFPTSPLLEIIDKIQSNTFPSESLRFVSKGIELLIHRNIDRGSFEWLNIFQIANFIDPQYKFIDNISFSNDKYIERFLEKLDMVIPYIDSIKDEGVYVKVSKWLIYYCNMKMFSRIWDLIAHSEEVDKQLHPCLVDRTEKIISKYDSVDLYKNFIELPEHIGKIVAEPFRKKALQLLINGQYITFWEAPRAEAIFNLLNSNRLYWTKAEYLTVLETTSHLNYYMLLNKFPMFLRNWIVKFKDIKDDEIGKICIQWYKKLMDRMSYMSSESANNEGTYVITIFGHLSHVCSIIGEQDVLNELMDMTYNRIKQSSEGLIFRAATEVSKMNSKAIIVFLKIIKERLSSVQNHDEYLLKKMRVICGCNENDLKIPNKLCEEILIHVMSCLRNNSSNIDFEEFSTRLHLSLFESANFWNVILRATGSIENFHSHPHIQEARNAILKLATMINDGSIDIHLLQDLLERDDNFLYYYLNSAKVNNEIITKEKLTDVRKKCRNYEQRLQKLNDFYRIFCSSEKVNDVKNYLDDLKERTKILDKISLEDTLSLDHWGKHKDTILIAENTNIFNKSRTFYNIFEKRITDQEDIEVEFIAKTLIQDVLNEYIAICKQYEGWKELQYSKATSFWYKVSDFDAELKLMKRYGNIYIDRGFMRTIKYLSEVAAWKERLKYLSFVLIIFEVKRIDNDWLETGYTDLNDDLSLGRLSSLFEILDDKFHEFTNDSWNLIKELSLSEEFIGFLRAIAEHDMKNLINGVDEHSDTRLIQEDTVSSLIQVKQFLLPLMNKANLTLDEFLKDLNEIVIKNSSLASKLTLCNSNCMALQNMYKNISNRGEVTKEKIQNAATIGTYYFDKEEKDDECILKLKYSTKSTTMSYDINELQDLRGRALLISKPGGSFDSGNGQIDNTKGIMEEFILQFDLAQNIIIIMNKLTQLGHFGYRKYNDLARTTKKLHQISERLKKDLETWEGIVHRAQQSCYYLTFYPARHILAFYDFYTKTGKQSYISRVCQTLVSFVNRKARLPYKQKSIGFSCKKDDYFQILKEIGDRLKSIFERLPKNTRSIKDSGERVVSDVVNCGELFVAACSDKFRVPNIIMSFYANHGFYPEPWQLLICTTSTTAEELSIFIKRCFLASKNGYNHHLFCIANLELLDFELQYNLVNNIREFTTKVDDYYLALICYAETGMHHHILDQFSENVHPTIGLSDSAMKAIFRELCPKVTCVTSDLSGQGKTEWIKQQSYRKGQVPKSFLISDGANFNSLVRQLKDFHLRTVDSLHINIISTDNPGEVNIFLFQLLTLGIVSNNSDIASLTDSNIFIEIASSVDQRLLKSLPFINCLDRPHLKWNINRLMVSQEIHSPIQIVCNYLHLYEVEQLDKKDVLFRPIDNDDDIIKVPLNNKLCQQLLDKYFFKRIDAGISSFRFLDICINVLADQLIRLSSSSFFEVHNLSLMIRENNIRSTLFNTLFDVSKDFATKSTQTKSAQLQAIADEPEIAQLKNLTQWDDSNHLLVFFMSQTPDSICALYRDKAKVPENVQNLLKSQYIGDKNQWKLADYRTMTSEQLLSTLECLARKTMHHIDYPKYALSVDNLLKMALMLLRTRANIPVVVCGEAGCGKTSLIGFLAGVVEVEFKALNLHAGITDQNIKDFMKESDKKAQNNEIWLFFDEINTCNHIGLLADLIAHRMLDGKPINPNIRLFAACNPYRIRKNSISSVGIKPKNIRFEEQSRLVYEVKPLPDQILDYVWDYGRLQPNDEKIYIQIMVKDQLDILGDPILSELLFVSQEFIRNVEEPYSVSLRDVKRAIRLVKFFYESLQDRKDYKKSLRNHPDLKTRSYILALGLCYQSRLYDRELRKKYREDVCKIFLREKQNIRESLFNQIIREEQMDYIRRMTCPPNTAFNEALLENVLVIIVCILNRIPLFLVGSPGSSKSLAIRLVSQNLRGSDSNDEYFRTLPQVFFIPHQGSSSSTSDGIEKVFKKAKAYQETSSKEFPVISVVLLDEVGLAETSPFNPLKVLHSLLEPSYPADGPTVSVVGISNWRLDNSKSSRALLVQRPKFDLDDLVETAVRLLDKNNLELPYLEIKTYEASLRPLAEAYSEYEAEGQVDFPNFHGLRDYYALVKNLSDKEMTPKNIHLALARNFGGIKKHTDACLKHFEPVVKAFNEHKSWSYEQIPINILINDNLESEGSRHLMIIGKNDSIVNILTYQLREMDKDPVVILGSQFPEDREDYSYSILSRIMMCVEAGKPLILTDLEIIYGSLYDLWNQNYITMGSSDNPRYFTRVALGAYANPMLYVHPDFRCILVLDEKKLKDADPPLLNRFEKQMMALDDILNKDQKELVNKLKEWTRQMSTIAGTSIFQSQNRFTQKDLFIGFNEEETLQSLVIDIKKKYPNMGEEEMFEKCKEALIAIATSDGMVRIDKSPLEFEEIQQCKHIYFQVQHHNDIADYFHDLLLSGNDVSANPDGHLIIVNTFSNINTNIKACLKNVIAKCYVLKLSIFKTESQFQKQMKQFWLDSDNELLILQCDVTTVNAECIKLAKFIIEQFRNDYLRKVRENNSMKTKVKHACIVLHIHRETSANLTSFNFMCGWKQITIETLAQQERPLSVLLEGNLCDIIENIYPFEDILKQEILWCLLCMKYPNNVKSVNHVKYLSRKILEYPNFVNCLKIRTQEWLKVKAKPDWQYHVASNKKMLYPYSSFSIALQAHIRTLVRQPIAKILCSLERLGVTKTYLIHDLPDSQMSDQRKQFLIFWKDMFMDNNIIDIDILQEPKPDGYTMPVSGFDLHFPFSFYFMKQIDNFKPIYEEEISLLKKDEENMDSATGELLGYIYEDYIRGFSKKIFNSIMLLKTSPLELASDLYFKDFVNVICNSETSLKNISVLSYILKCKLGKDDVLNPILLHIFWWKHASSTLAEFQLVHMCPAIINHIYMDDGELTNADFDDYLVNEVTNMMLKVIKRSQETTELQHEIRKVLNLCEKISGVTKTESFQLLQICYDLLSTELIQLETIKEIIKIGDSDDEVFSPRFIHEVFEIFRNIEFEQTSKILFAKQSFVMKSLEIIPFESPCKLELYRILFLEDPFPLMGKIIKGIFDEENENEPFKFFTWLDKPEEMLNSLRFEIINECLEHKGCDSSMAALICDIIQTTYFTKYDLIQLSPYFRYAVEALYTNNKTQALQKITAIAFLKEFVHKLWDSTIQDGILQSLEFYFMEIGDFDSNQIMNQINYYMENFYPLIHSLKIYFIRDLRNREYSMDDIKKFCQAQKYTLPWLGSLAWDDNQNIRLQFNAYYSFEDYSNMEHCFSLLYSYNNKDQFNSIFKTLKKKESTNARISFMGIILNRLHAIRATRDWGHVENQAAEFLNEKVEQIPSLSIIYRQTIKNIIRNQHHLLYLDMNTNNSDLLIKSVIGHVVALHSSIPAETSPLANLLQNLNYCSGLYILTCPSDVESIVLSAILQKNGQFTRYKCQCGYVYLIGDCGRANGLGKCPECGNMIGGENHVSRTGNTMLDNAPINRNLVAKDEKGYIAETVNDDINHNVRNLPPASYRILHLFVHSIIGAWAPSGTANTFLQKNNNTANDSVAYCMGHIKNDWKVLLKILNCREENLALLLHAILDRMILNPPKDFTLKTPAEREEWETKFAQNYVSPLIKNVTNTATVFRAKLDAGLAKSQGNSNIIEGEVNQTLPMDHKYKREYLPRLWRSIGTISFQGFRAYYNSDMEKHEAFFPFISVFFRYCDKLEKIKHLWPIVNFVQIISSRLGYRLSREKAQEKTFQEFINEESNDGEFEVYKYLTINFNDFANAWNSVINDVDQFQCHELPKPKPDINLKSPISLALVESKDSGVFLCAILEYLIGLQNNFLQEVLTIPIGHSKALKFLEESYFIQGNTFSSSSRKHNAATHNADSKESSTRYYLQSLRIDQTKQDNFINYKWDDEILQNSDRDLEPGRGQDIIYDLQKIETELAHRLVFEKVHIETLNGSQAYMEPFPYHMELFQGHMRILGDIKSIIPQQHIPFNIPLITGVTNNSYRHQNNINSLSYDNASELLSSLEILLCFVKRTSVGNSETKIADYVNQWMKLSILLENKSFSDLLGFGLCLKHLIALYELIEDRVANSVIKYVDEKFKTELTDQVKDEINLAIGLELASDRKCIPAEIFATALKRFMQRFLDPSRDQHPLKHYINDEGLNLWPTNISDELLDDVFPDSLLVCHIYEAYTYVNSQFEEIRKKHQQMGRNKNKHKASVNSNTNMDDRSSEFDHNNSDDDLTTVPMSSEYVDSLTGTSSRSFNDHASSSSSFAGPPSSRPFNDRASSSSSFAGPPSSRPFNDRASSSSSGSFAGPPSSRPFNDYASNPSTGPSSRPVNEFASNPNSFAGPSRPRASNNSPSRPRNEQQRRRPKKHGNNNKFDNM
ncbi:hypothetical protein C1645_834051 [Glomus cerebriforme]|uniref:RZ-type domain-containing protein n=2 Tax=Glomus cerebriforme TaxID=658196 RepID=A0A397SCR6_9GLOM|nr:hypothetical protein C1645_834051 [Glomus cerebriforme]